MLREVNLKNLAIIDWLSLSFESGLNVLTGETGAGKSLILSALHLLSGEKATPEIVGRLGSEALIEGLFEFGHEFHDLKSALGSRGISWTESEDRFEILIRRTILAEGRGRTWINGQIVQRADLVEIGRRLVDIAAQFEYQQLLDRSNHVNLVDEYAGLEKERREFQVLLRAREETRVALDALCERSRTEVDRREYLRFQLEELRSKGVTEGEKVELELDHRRLSNAARLIELARGIGERLMHDDGSASEKIGQALKLEEELALLDPSLRAGGEELRRMTVLIRDRVAELDAFADRIDASDERLSEVEARLKTLEELKRKYRRTIPELIAYQHEIESELATLDTADDRITELQSELQRQTAELDRRARELMRRRSKIYSALEQSIRKELTELKLPHAEIKVFSEPTSEFTPSGKETIELKIALNPGEPLLSLKRGISGGELSRLFLAIKTVISSKRDHPVCVFDEVDTGVGGDVAQKVGIRLKRLSNTAQVICITHLPQIAAFADAHFRVEKSASAAHAEVSVRHVEGRARQEELARMLGGDHSATALKHADTLLRAAAQP